MNSSPCAVAAVLAVLGLSAWAQGPVPAMTAPPTIYSSSPPSAAVRSVSSDQPRIARPPAFAAGSVPGVTRMTDDAREERRFLREAAAQSRFELEASKIAFAKSSNAGVRALAASVINHQNTSSLELTHLLHGRGMAQPMIGNDQRKALNLLTKASGSKFDSAFMQQVGLAQANIARDYEKASATIREPQVNAWILKTLAAARYHQMMAERSMPGDPKLSKLNRAAPRAPAVKAPVAAVQPARGALAAQPQRPDGTLGIQPVAASQDTRLSGSDTR